MNLKTVTAVSEMGALQLPFLTPDCQEATITLPASSPLLANPVLSILPTGDAVLVGDWTAAQPGHYHIPAALVQAVRRALSLVRVQ